METTQYQLCILGIHLKMIKKSTPISYNLTQNYTMLNFSKSKQKDNTTQLGVMKPSYSPLASTSSIACTIILDTETKQRTLYTSLSFHTFLITHLFLAAKPFH